MDNPVFALVDCNNFFVACEQIFRPDLQGKPVVVLSSNDGCAISRSAEVKALGIPMGAPAFKYKELFRKHDIQKFSANFELYGDISRRITEILTSVTPRLEVYSIDESFLDLSELDIRDCEAWGREVRARIEQWIGVTVSIGIAPTKTLAKLANLRAKKDPSLNGVLHLARGPSSSDRCKGRTSSSYLAQTPVEDIWGIGRRTAPQLRSLGLGSALDVASLSPAQGRKILGSVNGERLIRELQGQSCLPLEQIKIGAHMVSATRTFGQDTNSFEIVQAAMASFVARAAHRMRTHNLKARRITVFVTTDRHKPYYRSWYKELDLETATNDTGLLASYATDLLAEIYQKGQMYHRAGFGLHDLEPDQYLQTNLLDGDRVIRYQKSRQRMDILDHVNDKYGRRTLHFASEDLARSWEPRKRIASPHYTTAWPDLPKVKII